MFLLFFSVSLSAIWILDLEDSEKDLVVNIACSVKSDHCLLT